MVAKQLQSLNKYMSLLMAPGSSAKRYHLRNCFVLLMTYPTDHSIYLIAKAIEVIECQKKIEGDTVNIQSFVTPFQMLHRYLKLLRLVAKVPRLEFEYL